MPRLARVTVPGLRHHVTQRGNRRQPVFFQPEDRQVGRSPIDREAYVLYAVYSIR